jgi:deoxyribodipyrimidine photo-lyase
MPKQKISIFWFRRDLRLFDNAAFYYALKGKYPVLPLFIFDGEILDKLSDETDKRVLFIHQEINAIQAKLESKYESSLLIKFDKPLAVYKELLNDYDVQAVYANRDYEPYARKRDKEIYDLLKEKEIAFKGYKDQVIFDKNEVLKDDGTPYSVFTPYMKKWKERLKQEFHLKSYPNHKYYQNLLKTEPLKKWSIEDIGFKSSDFKFPNRKIDDKLITSYHKTRDYPAKDGTTKLSLHLRFGTISIRELGRVAKENNEKFFNELIWRDFYQMILFHFPETPDTAFKKKYDKVRWENNEDHFKKWCDGKTGFPIVDAGMRELNSTGFMHNRVRMITSGFLCKHLLIDWRWGEAYFAEKLLDYDQASNVGGWQWSAGSGVDAAPYFRIFNPTTQIDKFDKDLEYIKEWVPEYETDEYPEPIVNHKEARERALARYKEVL